MDTLSGIESVFHGFRTSVFRTRRTCILRMPVITMGRNKTARIKLGEGL